MPENIEAWWARRQRSKGREVPYPVGSYREQWAEFPMLVRQYHPDLNRMITLTQIPPAADVYLTWQCDAGHLFVATPEEQRSRPGRVRRRSAWCPVCAEQAVPTRIRPAPAPPTAPPSSAASGTVNRSAVGPPSPGDANRRHAADGTADHVGTPVSAPATSIGGRAGAPADPVSRGTVGPVGGAGSTGMTRTQSAASWARAPGAPAAESRPSRASRRRPALPGPRTPGPADGAAAGAMRAAGQAFWSPHAPPTASAAEAVLRQKLGARLEFDPTPNAVAVTRPFHGRKEVWPDIVIGELRVALEYDTVGRFGLEHVGPRETSDRSKDHVLRAAGWEVVRIRCAPLRPLGPHDVTAGSTITGTLIDRVLDALREIRGDLIVNAYLRR